MPSLETVSDLTKLANLDSSEILQQLKTNFENDKIYVSTNNDIYIHSKQQSV